MNTQELFEIQYNYFSQPNTTYGYTPPLPGGTHGTCVYNENGYKCAIGCALPEGLYEPEMEGKSVSELFDLDISNEWQDEFFRVFGDVDENYLSDSQNLHDSCAMNQASKSVFLDRLCDLASKYDLNIPEA